MIVCAGGSENFDFAKSIGIGLVESAINLTQICLEFKPKKLIFIGTCGLYDSEKSLLEIYPSCHAFNIEFSKLDKGFYSPAKIEVNLSENLNNVSCETLQKKFYKSNASNYICTDKISAKEFYNFGLELENMEVFSVFSVAENFKIPALAYLCATNFCDEFAHENFMKNHQKAKENLVQFLKDEKLI